MDLQVLVDSAVHIQKDEESGNVAMSQLTAMAEERQKNLLNVRRPVNDQSQSDRGLDLITPIEKRQESAVLGHAHAIVAVTPQLGSPAQTRLFRRLRRRL